MRYARLFHMSTGYVAGSIPPVFREDNRKPIPDCGSDSIVYIDGRWGNARAIAYARAECKRRGRIGFTMNAGMFGQSREIRALELIA